MSFGGETGKILPISKWYVVESLLCIYVYRWIYYSTFNRRKYFTSHTSPMIYLSEQVTEIKQQVKNINLDR